MLRFAVLQEERGPRGPAEPGARDRDSAFLRLLRCGPRGSPRLHFGEARAVRLIDQGPSNASIRWKLHGPGTCASWVRKTQQGGLHSGSDAHLPCCPPRTLRWWRRRGRTRSLTCPTAGNDLHRAAAGPTAATLAPIPAHPTVLCQTRSCLAGATAGCTPFCAPSLPPPTPVTVANASA